jgi:type II secretory pathway pseudopilin PulG
MRRHARRSAFTLIEAVVVILALGISLPTTLVWLDQANQRRADGVNQTRASALASLVMEHVLADISSRAPGRGFDALATPATYLNHATDGLTARLAAITGPYTAMGVTYSVSIGGLVSRSGVASGSPTQDLFRNITVTVSFTGADGTPRTAAIQSLVTSL